MIRFEYYIYMTVNAIRATKPHEWVGAPHQSALQHRRGGFEGAGQGDLFAVGPAHGAAVARRPEWCGRICNSGPGYRALSMESMFSTPVTPGTRAARLPACAI
jgi:hypothetical protein